MANADKSVDSFGEELERVREKVRNVITNIVKMKNATYVIGQKLNIPRNIFLFLLMSLS
jgi:hypothetical protein